MKTNVTEYKCSIGKYEFDYRNSLLKQGNIEIHLTPNEREIIKALHANLDKVVSHDILMQTVWGRSDYYISRSYHVHMVSLRKKISGDNSIKIITSKKIGYRLTVKNEQ